MNSLIYIKFDTEEFCIDRNGQIRDAENLTDGCAIFTKTSAIEESKKEGYHYYNKKGNLYFLEAVLPARLRKGKHKLKSLYLALGLRENSAVGIYFEKRLLAFSYIDGQLKQIFTSDNINDFSAAEDRIRDWGLPENAPIEIYGANKPLSELFDARRDRVVRQLQAQPVFKVARVEWNPRQTSTNANIARELVPYVVNAMQAAYEFSAPSIEFSPAAGFLGTYDIKHHKITLTPQLFGKPLKEFLDTLVHEEIHAFQADVMLMLNVQRKGRVLSPAERAIAQYWKNEEPKYRSALAAGSSMSPETRRRYQMIGQEYHAWSTGHFVATKVLEG